MYKSDIKVVDCTVRDGGLMNKWQFDDKFVKGVYDACVEAGVDYMEIGYISSEKSFNRNEVGPWKFCADNDLRRIMGNNDTSLKISAMADIGRIDFDDIPPASESLIDMMRVACYAHQTDKAIELAHHCMDKGYETTINLMAVSKVNERDLDEALTDVAQSRVPVFYLVDSFGSMYCETIEHLLKKYKAALPEKEIGIHAHNNMQLAMSNTITALMGGATYLDATLLGMGRGAGNCPIEILTAFLKNPKYRLLPLLKAIQEEILPWQQKIDWGYHIPYLVTGALNEHPRSAMAWMDSDRKTDFVAFMKEMHDYE
ncbi:aldolase catalytic domain-containing protein [Mangrovibacterium diazotrophicum]|uniref:4-hydroxy 2-oxovalerate aldolase n=1 Tax=Mangrovibacterium diazotrophicum TaxID=1261403 RepID=A0A419W4Z1_9BACT|nr:aldolase catalytic domain-containing protein [Mangrovibacterium diazotrophicum]RKD90541.1 4-hydroxy 2-oxovalerate aldolase [Mangrovibacterium diazotrophicum]